MSATGENQNIGEYFVLADVRMRGEQPVGVAGAAARAKETHILVRIGRVLIYLEDRAGLASLRQASVRPTCSPTSAK